jgi:signal transduction histidine kinase
VARASSFRRWHALAPVALAALIALLATLQYRWTGELGRAEEEKARNSLRHAAAGFAAEFDRELVRLFFHFAPPMSSPFEAELARRAATWRRSRADDPLRRVLLVSYDGAHLSPLRGLDEATGRWSEIPWPEELRPLRDRFVAPAGDRRWGAIATADVPALVVPLFPYDRGWLRRAEPRSGMRAPAEPAAAHALLWLSMDDVRRRMLPLLVSQYFGFEVDYRVEVRGSGERLIFSQGPAVPGGHPDVVVPMFRPPFAERLMRHHGEHGRGERLRLPRVASDDDPMPGRWSLSVTHPAGSLAAAVARARWRNLAISFVVLGLLAAAVTLVLAAARRAEALARRQIELVAGVSHELLTPVAAVRSAGENLAAGVVRDPEKVKEYGELIVREGRRLGGLVEQVLTWAGLQARGEPAVRRPVDVAAVVTGAVAACATESAAAGVRVEMEVAPGLPLVEGDAEALERALRNLVENAVRHGGDGGWVGVRAYPRTLPGDGGTGLVLAVEDRGPGLAEEDLPHLFEPFYRGRRSAVAGSGLGLALARQIAEAHGGRLRVAAVSPRGARGGRVSDGGGGAGAATARPDPARGGRAEPRDDARGPVAGGGLRRRGGARRRRRVARRARRRLRPAVARRHAAGPRRLRGLPRAAPAGRGAPGPHAHRAHPGG